ncbi:alpha/beta fold hydrolase [Candidatus Saccharibacteria bacterium]|nr:alpha/beta fold hydrolase [Candidatus Saccharibacteria bacterium]
MLELAKTYDVCDSKTPEMTVVFLHGIAADSSDFKGLLGYLVGDESMKRVRLATFDLLGAGKSYTSDELEYTFDEQLEALKNSVDKLNVTGPLVIVAHSMGTMIATRFAEAHKRLVRGLVLISAPVFKKEDIENPMFEVAMNGFREVVGRKMSGLLTAKSFNNEIKNIVSNKHNYDFLVRVSKPTIIIYGELDKIIAPFNIPGLLKGNPNITAIKTAGSHGITREKYHKVLVALQEFLSKEEG